MRLDIDFLSKIPCRGMVNKSKGKIQKFKSDPIERRLNRIEGQIKGIKKMYRKDPCDAEGITTQIQAARAALAKVAVRILTDEAQKCAEEGDIEKLEKLVNKTFKSL